MQGKLIANFDTQMSKVFNKLSVKMEKKLKEDCVKFTEAFIDKHRQWTHLI